MSEAATPQDGAMTRDQAIEALTERPEPAPAPKAPKAAAEAVEEEDPEGETSTPEEAEDGDETPAEDEEAEAEDEAVAPAEPPKYWSQDAKAKFAELPPELQAVVLEQEGPREEAAAKAKAEAAQATQAAQAEIAKVQQLAEVLGERVGQWVETFKSRWGTQTPDWSAYAQENGVEAMVLLKTQFEAEQHQLAEAVQTKTIAENQAHEVFVKAEFTKLAEIAPDLADPVKGAEKRKAVVAYLVKSGIPADALPKISASEMLLAQKAMLWDQAQAKPLAAPKPKIPQPAAKAPVRPAAAAPQVNTATREANQIRNRLAQTRDRDDAAALIMKLGL